MSTLRATILRVLLACGISFALWAFVSFSQNPESTVTFSDVPLEAVGLEPGLVIVDANGVPTQALPPVDITLSTDQQQLTQLRPVDVRAVADLSGRGSGDHIIPVNVQPTRSNLSFTVPEGGTEPAAVPIRLEQLSLKQVPVQLDVQGNLPFSFEQGAPAISAGGQRIAVVEVSGPQSRVERVEGARAVANIEQLRATYQASLALTPIDAADLAVEGVTVRPLSVSVQIPINPVVGLKLVPVEPAIIGLPAAGFEVTGVLVEPPLLALTGSSGPLDAVERLATAPLDISGARQSVERTVAIRFPEDTAPRAGEPDEVRVTVQLGPIALPFQVELPVPVVLSGLGAGLQFSVSPQVVSVSVSGSSDAIAGLAQAPLRATVDVSGLGPGGYQIPVAVALPPGLALVGDPPTVAVTLRQPPAAPTDTATPEPGTPTPSPSAGAEPPGDTPTPPPPGETPGPTTAPPEPTPTGGPEPAP